MEIGGHRFGGFLLYRGLEEGEGKRVERKIRLPMNMSGLAPGIGYLLCSVNYSGALDIILNGVVEHWKQGGCLSS